MQIRAATPDDDRAPERLWARQNARHVALHPSHVREVDGHNSVDAFTGAMRFYEALGFSPLRYEMCDRLD